MTLLNKSQLKYIVAHMPENRLKKKIEDQKKRKKETEFDSSLPKNSINLPLKRLSKLPASDILKLLYNFKEEKQKFVLT
jgi:hypothetical protein